MHKLVTILVPSYNHQDYIKTILNSILNQTYLHIELLIFDDCSKDNTAQEIESFLPKFSEKNIKVNFIRNAENLGLQKTLCKAKEFINGDYLFPIASDDFIAENAIEALVETMNSSGDIVLVASKNFFVDENEKIFYLDSNEKKTYEKNKAKIFTFNDLILKKRPDVDYYSENFGSYESLLISNYITNGFLIRKSAFDKVGGYSGEAMLEDWFLVLQLSKIGKFKYEDKAVTYYRKHSQSTSNNFDWMKNAKKQTYALELEKAKEFGKLDLWLKYKDYEFSLTCFGIKIFSYKKTFQKTIVKLFGISLFKIILKDKKKVFYLLNIPFWGKGL